MDLENAGNGIRRFCASSFVKTLIKKGGETACDETSDEHDKRFELPAYFDRDKFKRGQQFFHKHIWAMLFSKIMGLVTILSIPDLVHILRFTKQSNVPLTAYQRYLKTVFHMYIWYNEDLYPGSKIWTSLEKVRSKHDNASQRSQRATNIFISQKNMALTQFGFMGYAVWRTKLVGIHHAEKGELEAFIHFWKVIGYLMGVQERFNICRDSLDETREICNELAIRVFKREILKKHLNFLELSHALLTGMWCMMPLLQYKPFIQLVADTITNPMAGANSKVCACINNDDDDDDGFTKEPPESVDFGLNAFQKLYITIMKLFLSTFRFAAIRVFHRYVIYISMWLMENFPFLAYYMFGKANSHITV